MDYRELQDEIRGLRRRVRISMAAQAVVTASVVALACSTTGSASTPPAGARNAESTELRLRRLVIEDEHGTARVILGAPVPDPISGARAASLYGMTIHAADGTERGGYGVIDATDAAILTLDAFHDNAVFKVVANKQAGASLFLVHQDGATAAMTTYRGDAELHLINGDETLTFPEGTPPLP